MRENTNEKNPVFGHFSRSDFCMLKGGGALFLVEIMHWVKREFEIFELMCGIKASWLKLRASEKILNLVFKFRENY